MVAFAPLVVVTTPAGAGGLQGTFGGVALGVVLPGAVGAKGRGWRRPAVRKRSSRVSAVCAWELGKDGCRWGPRPATPASSKRTRGQGGRRRWPAANLIRGAVLRGR